VEGSIKNFFDNIDIEVVKLRFSTKIIIKWNLAQIDLKIFLLPRLITKLNLEINLAFLLKTFAIDKMQ
jgi:hypothetical protein